jgi:single-strand DNA-binding protein
MAEGLNKVLLLGNLGADPELRVTPGGQAVLKLRLATTESYLDKSNTRQERTEWHRITIWGKRGEALAKFLTKGERIFIEGRIQTSSYEKNGEKRYSTEIIANNVILAGGGRRGDRPAEGGEPRSSNRGAPSTSRDDVPPSNYDAGPPPGDDFGGGGGGGGGAGGGDDEIPF